MLRLLLVIKTKLKLVSLLVLLYDVVVVLLLLLCCCCCEKRAEENKALKETEFTCVTKKLKFEKGNRNELIFFQQTRWS